MTKANAPEFSRPLAVTDLAAQGWEFAVTASADERAALAVRFGLLAVESLAVDGRMEPSEDGTAVRLHARLVADVVQACVATLELVASRIDSAFERLYSHDIDDEWGPRAEIDRDQDDELDEAFPEPLTGGSVDIGESAAERARVIGLPSQRDSSLVKAPRVPLVIERIYERRGERVVAGARRIVNVHRRLHVGLATRARRKDRSELG